MTTTQADQLVAWIAIVGLIAIWAAIAIALWRTRAGGGLPEQQVECLLEELIEDFDELAALAARHPEWFLEPERRERELRLARLHGDLADESLRQLVAVCRAAYLACWALSSADPPVPAEADLSTETRRGSTAAECALLRIRAS